jgi:DNA ligase (NAD+)
MGKKKETNSQIILYRAEDGHTQVEVNLQKETVWLTLNQIGILFDRDKSVISRHLQNIYKTRELAAAATVAKFATVQMEGQRQVIRQVEYYNLDAIVNLINENN